MNDTCNARGVSRLRFLGGLLSALMVLLLPACVQSIREGPKSVSPDKARVTFSFGTGPAPARFLTASSVRLIELEALASGSAYADLYRMNYDPNTGTVSSRPLELAPGSWHFTARAYGETKNLIFAGEADADLAAGAALTVAIVLEEVPSGPSPYALDLSFGRYLDAGQFISLSGIAWGPDNRLYVMDPDNHWIQIWDVSGASPAYEGHIGESNGWVFNTPYQMTLDSEGGLWIADRPSNAVRHAWELNGSWLVDELRDSYYDAGVWRMFTNPEGIAVSGSGAAFRMYVVNTGKREVLALDSNFALISKWSTESALDGSNGSRPSAIALWTDTADGVQYAYITDPAAGLVKKFKTDGTLAAATNGYANAINELCGIAVDPSGRVFVSDRWHKSPAPHGTIHVFDKNLTPLFNRVDPGSGNGQLDDPRQLCLSPDGTKLAVSDSLNHRFQILSIDLGNGNLDYAAQGGEKYEAADQFAQPLGAAYDSAGNLYVLDRIENSVKKYDADGRYLLSWGEREPKALGYATNIATRRIGGSDYVFLYEGVIKVYDSVGGYLGQFDLENVAGSAEFSLGWFPETFMIDSGGDILLGSHQYQGIVKLDANVDSIDYSAPFDESPSVLWEKRGAGAAGGLSGYWALAEASDGTILTIDRNANLAAVLDPADGSLLREVDGTGSEPGQFREPSAVSVASDGTIFVADWGNRRINVYDSALSFLYSFGEGELNGYVGALAARGDGFEVVAVSERAPNIKRFTRAP